MESLNKKLFPVPEKPIDQKPYMEARLYFNEVGIKYCLINIKGL